MKLIGINGKKRSGKDTTFLLLEDMVGDRVVRAAFADKLKVMAARALGYEGTSLELIDLMDQFKETGVVSSAVFEPSQVRNIGTHITGRQYLQLFGQKARDVFGDQFWVDQVLPNPAATQWAADTNRHNMELRYPGVDYVAITDVRYPNEAMRVKALGGQVWEITRPELDDDDSHDSEQTLPRDLVDYEIVNDGTVEDLRAKIEAVLV